MSTTLTIKSVKCLKPSSGIDDVTRGIFGAIGAIAGGVAGAAATTATGGVLVATVAIGAIGGAGAGVYTIEGLDKWFSGSDDLYVKVNGNKIWPADDYKSISSQLKLTLGYSIPLKDEVSIELMEYDSASSDDNIGSLSVPPDHQDGYATYLLTNEDEGSIYELIIKVETKQATPQVDLNVPEKIAYGSELRADQFAASASIPGAFSFDPPLGTKLSAGNHKVRVTFTPKDSRHYKAVTKSISVHVPKEVPTVTWSEPQSIIYGTRLTADQLNANASVPGSFDYSPSAGSRLQAGNNQVLQVVFTPEDKMNYETVTKSVSINVTKATPKITWANPPAVMQGTAFSKAMLSAKADVKGTFAYNPAVGDVPDVGLHQPLKVTFSPTDKKNYRKVTKTVFLDVKGPNLGTQISFVNGRNAQSGSRAGWYWVTEVDTNRVIAKWYASRGSKDSGPMTTLPLSFDSVHVAIIFHPDNGGAPVKMKVVNPAPNTPYGWVTKGQVAVIVVEYP